MNNSLNWKSNPHIIVELENCNLLLLNTALTAGAGDDDENKLLIGSSYLNAAVANIKNRKPIIAVGHHGLDFIEREEKNFVQIILIKKTYVFIFVDIHMTSHFLLLEIKSSRLIVDA